ncbi:proline dehydrogenase [Acrocarpospora pleiomorpha]|uniref:Proline dehydrogenase n=1 Tax=Acrocarpospora pleiomorpha TaxID=90975 RepID=A0A5M3XD54_9ACTN|nr:(2Fe-2S)-binding protein [Acrocarpospora pleiomorpha]GES19154.1 proline dehydrogenase [Acrocarpospora pleiomorpha]
MTRVATIIVDDRPVTAVAGVSLTAALVGDRRWALRRNPVDGGPRGPFCGMGVCFECEVTVDGVSSVRACLTRIRPGMRVDTGAPDDR